MNKHKEEVHNQAGARAGVRKNNFSHEEKKINGFCRFWNHTKCLLGKECAFLHEAAPYCRFDQECRAKSKCQYFHEENVSSGNHSLPSSSSSSFLGHRQFPARSRRNPQSQRFF